MSHDVEKKRQKNWWWRNSKGIPFVFDEKTGTTSAKEWVSWPCLGLPHAKPTGPHVGLKYQGKPLWNDGLERNAYAYELARRADRRLRLPPFVKLSQREQHYIHGLFCTDSDLRAVARWTDLRVPPPRTDTTGKYRLIFPQPKLTPPPGFTDPGWMWNLREANHALKQQFLRWIEQQRVEHGVPKPKPRTRTKNQKRVRWKFLELLDTTPALYGDSERSRKSKALKEARQNLDKLRAALSNPASYDVSIPVNAQNFPNLIRAVKS